LYIFAGHFGKCFLHFGNRNGGPSTQEDVDKVLKSLNDLSLTITTGGGESSAPAAGAEEPPAENANAAVQTKTINLNVELLKFGAKKNEGGNANNAGEEGGDNNATNSSPVNGATAAGGEASGAAGSRIESVDTTTV